MKVRKHKWDSYTSGEELFGLPVTQFPELERTQEEIQILDKLYRCVPPVGHIFSKCLLQHNRTPYAYYLSAAQPVCLSHHYNSWLRGLPLG